MSEGVPNRDGIISETASTFSLLAVDKFIGEKVVDENGEHLGEVANLMLDVHDGRIAYAVLTFGGFLGVESKLFAVPWHALAVDVDNKWFVLNVSKERLKSAPGFDKDNWPTVAESEWFDEVQAYYGPVAASRKPFI